MVSLLMLPKGLLNYKGMPGELGGEADRTEGEVSGGASHSGISGNERKRLAAAV